MKLILKIFEKCNHYTWKYQGEKIFQHNEPDDDKCYGLVHDIIKCKECGKLEHHVNWKRSEEEHEKFVKMLRNIHDKIYSKK